MPFDLAQGGELVEPFRNSDFVLRIFSISAFLRIMHNQIVVVVQEVIMKACDIYQGDELVATVRMTHSCGLEVWKGASTKYGNTTCWSREGVLAYYKNKLRRLS